MGVTARLINKQRIPYGGKFNYVDPDTGHELWAVTWENLIHQATAHRRANNLPIGLGFEDRIEEQCCLDLPEECTDPDPSIPKKTQLTLWDVVRGSQVMMSFVANGSQIVDRAEAERRAEICTKCVYNSAFLKPCGGICAELKNVVSSIIDHQGTRFDAQLKSCNICSCFLQASIWLRLEDQCKGVTDEMRQQFSYVKEKSGCWKVCQ